MTSADFVGRDGALRSITSALAEPPALVLIEGEAGIGKSRLVQEAVAARSSPERAVLSIACPPLTEPFPLGPVIDGLRRVREQVARVQLPPLCGALRPLLPEWSALLPPAMEPLDDPKETRHRLFRAITDLVERLGVGVVVVEDAHWSDPATLEWLLTLTTTGTAVDQRLSVLATYRPLEIAETSPLLRLTSRLPPSMRQLRIELDALDVDQTRSLIGALCATEDVSDEFAAYLHQRTDGVPLAVQECVRLLRDREDIVRREGHWSRRAIEDLDVPPTVRDSVLERLGRLDSGTRQVLAAAAVLSHPADEATLAAVAGLDPDAGRPGVAAALASGLLREAEQGTFTFRHVLDAQAVDSAIPVSEQRRLHAQAAERLRHLDPEPVARLSRHCREAGDVGGWCHYAELSADLAAQAGNDRAAVSILLQLLAEVEHPVDRRTRLARKLGAAAYGGAAALGDLAGQVAEALRTALADGLASPGERGEIRLLLGRMLREISAEPAAYAEIEASIVDLDDRPDLALRAMTNLSMPLVPDWPSARHLAWLERATALLPRVDSAVDALWFRVNRATALLLLGQEAGWQAVEDITRSADPRIGGQAMLNAGQLAVVWGRYDDARRLLRDAAEHLRDSGYRRLTSTAQIAEAHLDWYTGAWDGLDDVVQRVAASDESVTLDQLQARQIHAALELARGARDAAQHHLIEITDTCARLGVVDPIIVLATGTLGRLHLANADADEALLVTARDTDMIESKGVWLWGTEVLPVRVDALVTAGRTEQAAALTQRFADGLADCSAPAPVAALAACRAIVAAQHSDPGEAASCFAAVAAAWAELPRPYDELLMLERQGGCLLAAGEHERGLAVLSDTQQRLVGLGARWDADRVARLLRQHGVAVSRAWAGGRRSYGDELSPRELDVIRLVAEGFTNRQIAEKLFLAPKTVARHVSRAMRKTGVTSRTGLAMAAAEAGLLDDPPT